MLFLFFFARETLSVMEGRTAPVLSIGVSFGIVKTVSSNGRVREKSQRRGFESHTIPKVYYTEFEEIRIGRVRHRWAATYIPFSFSS